MTPGATKKEKRQMTTETLKQEPHSKSDCNQWGNISFDSLDQNARAKLLVEAACKPLRVVRQLDWFGDRDLYASEGIELRNSDIFRFYMPAGGTHEQAVNALENMLEWVKSDSEAVSPPPSQPVPEYARELLTASAGHVLNLARNMTEPKRRNRFGKVMDTDEDCPF